MTVFLQLPISAFNKLFVSCLNNTNYCKLNLNDIVGESYRINTNQYTQQYFGVDKDTIFKKSELTIEALTRDNLIMVEIIDTSDVDKVSQINKLTRALNDYLGELDLVKGFVNINYLINTYYANSEHRPS